MSVCYNKSDMQKVSNFEALSKMTKKDQGVVLALSSSIDQRNNLEILG